MDLTPDPNHWSNHITEGPRTFGHFLAEMSERWFWQAGKYSEDRQEELDDAVEELVAEMPYHLYGTPTEEHYAAAREYLLKREPVVPTPEECVDLAIGNAKLACPRWEPEPEFAEKLLQVARGELSADELVAQELKSCLQLLNTGGRVSPLWSQVQQALMIRAMARNRDTQRRLGE